MDKIAAWFTSVIAVFNTMQFKDVIDIAVITLIIFSLFQIVRQTRAEQLLKGVIVLLVLYIFSNLFQLTMLTSLLKALFQSAVLIIIIVFQPEIRNALEKLGRNKVGKKYFGFLTSKVRNDDDIAHVRKAIIDVADTALVFSKARTGALIVFERTTKLSDIAVTGTVLNSETSVALLGNIFYNKAPLHDGATIIRDGLIYASGCILPLTSNKSVDINLGTRHRAALGMSEQSDAVVLVVSEETGNISIALEGRLTRDYNRETLIEELERLLIETNETPKYNFLSFFKRKEKKNDEK